ncbi:uncharacterized protein LOC124944878 [Impatiens glandulifera]|uniref:uncharacterized protein LOC124944878 n=1 Tax=Impatiens glandulifera TaxID=253017 RepID=UPI001FB0A57C|nr:uncharacterized protein LOC124944878 [Impatiens glandulifera]
MDEIKLDTSWEDMLCPICLEFPHNCVLLQCSSYEKGCRTYVCDTDHLLSNCLDRFRNAHGMSSGLHSPESSESNSLENRCSLSEVHEKPSCPLCRGVVTGWIIIDDARAHMNEKKRCCEEDQCAFAGTYSELQEHALQQHPYACPAKIDPARQLDWENFQQSSEIIDVLTTIHAGIPHGIVLGDYVIEYGDNDTGDELDEFRRDERNWFTSCMLYQVFDNLRSSRNRRRSRANNSRRSNQRLDSENIDYDVGSVVSLGSPDYRNVQMENYFSSQSRHSWTRVGFRSSRRRNSSRFIDG